MRWWAWLGTGIVATILVLVVLHPLAGAFAIGVYPAPAGTPWTYQLLSGFLPALTVLTLGGLLSGAWRRINCHTSRCWRIGRHHVNGSPWCDKHWPEEWHEITDHDLLVLIASELVKIRKATAYNDNGSIKGDTDEDPAQRQARSPVPPGEDSS